MCFGGKTHFPRAWTPGPELDTNEVISVAMGRQHTCVALRNGSVACFGECLTSGDVPLCSVPPNLGPATSLSAGEEHTCALLTSGLVTCWGGSNQYGERDVMIGVNEPVVAVTAGAYHTCVRLTSAAVHCRGSNSRSESSIPAAAVVAASVVAGDQSTCVVTPNRAAVCWGQLQAPPDLGPVTQIGRPSAEHNCALTVNGIVRCWGNSANFAGINGLSNVTAISVGDHHVCAVLKSGQLRCAGKNDCGQADVPESLRVPGMTISSAMAGSDRTCVIIGLPGEQCGTFLPPRECEAVCVCLALLVLYQLCVRARRSRQKPGSEPVNLTISGLAEVMRDLHTHLPCMYLPPTALPCKPGFGGRWACATCPAATWSPGGNVMHPMVPCRPCPAGRTTPAKGATSSAQCTGVSH